MKKKTKISIAISAAAVVAFSGVLITLTALGIIFPRGTRLNTKMFNGFKMDWGNASSLAIATPKNKNAQASNTQTTSTLMTGVSSTTISQNSQDINTSRNPKKNEIIGIDDDGQVVDVTIKNIKTGKAFTQGDFKGQIIRLYVAEDYIYFMVTSHPDLESYKYDYGGAFHLNPWHIYHADSYYQYKTNGKVEKKIKHQYSTLVFLVDRINGNIYSLAELFPMKNNSNYYIHDIQNDIIVHGIHAQKKVFKLETFSNRAEYTLLNSNVNLQVSEVYVDKTGTAFIVTANLNEDLVQHPDFNDVYFVSSASYALSVDGDFYRVRFSPRTLHIFSDGVWQSPSSSINTFLYEPLHSMSKPILVRNGTETQITNFDAETLHYQEHMIIGDNFIYRQNNEVKYFNFRAIVPSVQTLLTGITSLRDYDGFSMLAFSQGPTGEIVNIIYLDDGGTPKYKKLSERNFESNIIVLQPLN